MNLKDRVAIVTGAASGIGLATVRRFANEGANVVACDIDGDGLARVSQSNEEILTRIADVTDSSVAAAMVEEAVDRFGKLDVLVNSAGVTARALGPGTSFEEGWDTVMRVNAKGSLLMSRAAVRAMRKTGKGAIVNLASIMGLVGYPVSLPFSDGFNAYPHSKGAIVQMTRDMGVRLAKENIRVNAVCPGFVYTALTDDVTKDAAVHETMKSLHPMGRLGDADEIANVIAFLASDAASFVTGAAWAVDGGYTAQ